MCVSISTISPIHPSRGFRHLAIRTVGLDKGLSEAVLGASTGPGVFGTILASLFATHILHICSVRETNRAFRFGLHLDPHWGKREGRVVAGRTAAVHDELLLSPLCFRLAARKLQTPCASAPEQVLLVSLRTCLPVCHAAGARHRGRQVGAVFLRTIRLFLEGSIEQSTCVRTRHNRNGCALWDLGGRTTGAEMPLARRSHIICSEFFGRTLSEPGACWRTLSRADHALAAQAKKVGADAWLMAKLKGVWPEAKKAGAAAVCCRYCCTLAKLLLLLL